jgi:hypothetical protein
MNLPEPSESNRNILEVTKCEIFGSELKAENIGCITTIGYIIKNNIIEII